ncbi:motility associated factor glycosyltransferase family protein, partial [Ralstonia pickettii]|nr:motility associated factor glycosyltransferase family protein [Ralstonia pickettii]
MLIDNTLFLRKQYPEVRNYFREYENDIKMNRVTVLESKIGVKTIQYETDEQKQLMVHSKYDPLKEAERIISAHRDKIKDDTHVFFYGIGLGYHIEEFQKLFPKHSYSLYEPAPEIFLTMTKHRRLNSIITANTKNLYTDTHDAESNRFLEEFASNNRSIHVITLPSYNNIAAEKVTHFREKIKKAIVDRRIGLHANAKFQNLWVKNSLLNFETVLNTPNMLKNIDRECFSGKPAIIVSAGPSLAEDIEHIKYIKEN